ncbi:MAG: QueT transporter family protein [Nitrososphaerota archaeon]
MRTRDLAVSVLLAALYAGGVIALPGLSFQVAQVRVSDALLPLSMVFGMPAVVGLTVGTFVANIFSPFGAVDLLGGTLTNLVATYLAWKMARNFNFRGRWLFAAAFQVLLITFVVGTYIQAFVNIPETPLLGFRVPGIVFSWLGVLTGSIISIMVIGYPVAKAAAKYLSREPF